MLRELEQQGVAEAAASSLRHQLEQPAITSEAQEKLQDMVEAQKCYLNYLDMRSILLAGPGEVVERKEKTRDPEPLAPHQSRRVRKVCKLGRVGVAASQVHQDPSKPISSNYRPSTSQDRAPIVPQTTSGQSRTSQQLPPPDSQSRSSILQDATSTSTFQPRVNSSQPKVFDLSDTRSITEVDSFPPITRFPEPHDLPSASKSASLETKVTSLLARLHQQVGVNLSLDIPQKKVLQGFEHAPQSDGLRDGGE